MLSTIFFTIYGLKFSANYFVFNLTLTSVLGVLLCIIPIIRSTTVIHGVSARVGACVGLTCAFKENVVTHLFPLRDATYIYGLTEAFRGIGAFAIPYAAGYIDRDLTHGDGLYFIGACVIFGSIMLCVPAVFRTHIWTRYEKSKGDRNDREIEEAPKLGYGDENPKHDEPERF